MNLLLEEINNLSSLKTPEEKIASMQAILRECKQIDYYRLLSVSSDQTNRSEVRRNYKELALKIHPDTVSEPYKELAGELFKLINLAHKTLSDSESNIEYQKSKEYETTRQYRPSLTPVSAPKKTPETSSRSSNRTSNDSDNVEEAFAVFAQLSKKKQLRVLSSLLDIKDHSNRYNLIKDARSIFSSPSHSPLLNQYIPEDNTDFLIFEK